MTGTRQAPSAEVDSAPDRAGPVLITLILVAAVANLNLAVANVALPDIGHAFDSSQTTLDLVAVGYSLGLAASVLWLGALGDRHGRKLMLVLGVGLSIPACVLAAYAPSDEVLFAAGLRHDRMSNTLSSGEVRRLYRAIQEIVQEAIRYRGTTLPDEAYVDLFGKPGEYQNELKVYGRKGLPCRRCRTPIESVTLGGRRSFYCPQCQS